MEYFEEILQNIKSKFDYKEAAINKFSKFSLLECYKSLETSISQPGFGRGGG